MTTLRKTLLLVGALGSVLGVAATFTPNAEASERYRTVTDPTYKAECGACHMAFQPQMLPKKSWQTLMNDLSNHFGEDASMKEEVRATLLSYLTENAADTGWLGGKFMRGLDENSAPLRISETPYWQREHNKEVSASAWNDPRVKSKANCLACHRDAERGNYDDDD